MQAKTQHKAKAQNTKQNNKATNIASKRTEQAAKLLRAAEEY